MPDLLPGSTVTGLDTPRTVVDAQSASYTTVSTTYTDAGATDCSVVFTAPTTGRVLIHTAARMVHQSTTSGCLLAPQTRTGGTVGGGTVVEDVSAATGPSHYGDNFARIGATHLLEGLTPGATYNTRLLHASSAAGPNTATFALRELIVEPAA